MWPPETRGWAQSSPIFVGRVAGWPSCVVALPDIEDGDAFALPNSDVHFTGAVIEIPVSADDNVGQIRRVKVRTARSVLKFDQHRVANSFQYLGEVGVDVRLP